MIGLDVAGLKILPPSLTQAQPDGGAEGSFIESFLRDRSIIIAANRGPITFHRSEHGEMVPDRVGGGLVTALTGLINHAQASWVACAHSEEDKTWRQGAIPLGENGNFLQMHFISPPESAYEGYYKVIANPLLWFLQHSMWDISHAPTIDRQTWRDWKDGYVAVNQLFAEAIARQILTVQQPALVMLQDYHLYLAPGMIRRDFKPGARYTLTHFIHIPWPGAEAWGLLPPKMRQAILEGLCAVDLLGFQTRNDGLNFIRTCESYLPRASVNFKHGHIWYRNHRTYVRDFPISIDVESLKKLAETDEVQEYRTQFQQLRGDRQLILRIDRIEPTKNIVRGFQAFDEMLDLHPEHQGRVQFLALLVPSRMEVAGYQNYLDELMGAAGRVNAKHGTGEWEPVRIMVGENYPRAVAALQCYDVLLVNSIADGMNLVAKEGPIVNRQNGVLILSERTGAHQQLEPGALVIAPLDIYATAEALHQALVMPLEERQTRAERLYRLVQSQDIVHWLVTQLETVAKLNL